MISDRAGFAATFVALVLCWGGAGHAQTGGAQLFVSTTNPETCSVNSGVAQLGTLDFHTQTPGTTVTATPTLNFSIQCNTTTPLTIGFGFDGGLHGTTTPSGTRNMENLGVDIPYNLGFSAGSYVNVANIPATTTTGITACNYYAGAVTTFPLQVTMSATVPNALPSTLPGGTYKDTVTVTFCW
jgi:spore coat protein U-like protein